MRLLVKLWGLIVTDTDPTPTRETADAAWEALAREFARSGSRDPEVARMVLFEHRPLIEAALSRSTPTPPETPDATALLHEIQGDLDARADNGDDLARDLGERLRSVLSTPTPDATDAGSREALREAVQKWADVRREGNERRAAMDRDETLGDGERKDILSDTIIKEIVADEQLEAALAAAPSTPTTEGLDALWEAAEDIDGEWDSLPYDEDRGVGLVDAMPSSFVDSFHRLREALARLGERP